MTRGNTACRAALAAAAMVLLAHPSMAAAPAAPADPRVDLLAGADWRVDDSDPTGTTFTAEFEAPDPSAYAALELVPNPRGRPPCTINDRAVELPLKGLDFGTVPAINAQVLQAGRNTIIVRLAAKPKDPSTVQFALRAMAHGDLAIQSGPTFGAVFADRFTVACRTNMPATVTVCLADDPSPLATSTGVFHQLKVPNGGVDGRRYVLRADNGKHQVQRELTPTMSCLTELKRFVALGDSRKYPDEWRRVAEAAASHRPQLLLCTGDMIGRGTFEGGWDPGFFTPGKALLDITPMYAVLGNHDAFSPMCDVMFPTPADDGKVRNWSQRVGQVLLVGLNGADNFVRGPAAVWLDKALAEGDSAAFIFVTSHYPPLSSSMHGKLDDEGDSAERETRRAQEVILPLLQKHGATAFICGHDHNYERSEPPGGVTVVTSGGAGAGLRRKSPDAERQNPHSAVFDSSWHYCLFEIEGTTCTMKALTPDGRVIDTRTWEARQAAEKDPLQKQGQTQ